MQSKFFQTTSRPISANTIKQQLGYILQLDSHQFTEELNKLNADFNSNQTIITVLRSNAPLAKILRDLFSTESKEEFSKTLDLLPNPATERKVVRSLSISKRERPRASLFNPLEIQQELEKEEKKELATSQSSTSKPSTDDTIGLMPRYLTQPKIIPDNTAKESPATLQRSRTVKEAILERYKPHIDKHQERLRSYSQSAQSEKKK